MALQPISLPIKPGVDTVSTPFQSLGQISESNLIRFLNGQIEKLGGCLRIAGSNFAGAASALLPFVDLTGIKYIGIGSGSILEVFSGGTTTDVSPVTGIPGSKSWSLDKFGQVLVGVAGGSIYQWVPPIGVGNIATVVPNSPTQANGLIVAAPQQQIITWGATSVTLGAQDPLLVRWCDVADLTDWTAAVNNQAGSFRMPHGSEIVAIMWPSLSGYLWTDVDVWSITYVNFPLVYGFNNIAQVGGLIAKRAVAQLGQTIAWMSQQGFFILRGGTVQPLACSVYDFVFGPNGIDRAHVDQIHADANTFYNEITWRFPPVGAFAVQCTAYVKATWVGDQVLWDYGTTAPGISAWTDESVWGPPIGAGYEPILKFFETGPDYDGQILDSGFLSGWFYLQESHVNVFMERIRPDFTINSGGEIELTLIFADEIPQEDDDYPVRTYGPYPVTAKTPFVIVRGSGSVARIRISCTSPTTFWRYGKPIANISIDGHR